MKQKIITMIIILLIIPKNNPINICINAKSLCPNSPGDGRRTGNKGNEGYNELKVKKVTELLKLRKLIKGTRDQGEARGTMGRPEA